MKRGFVFVLVFLFFLISISLINASEEEQINNAYSCIENKINQTNCSTSFSFEDKVFSLLATGNSKCKNAVMLENLSNSCWPKSECNLVSTSQAVLALRDQGVNITNAKTWILSKTTTPKDMDWFLEIESPGATSCAITYSGSSATISIGEDKKISSNAGSSLTLAQDGYWLKISPDIYNTEIGISCDKQFMTTLLFKKKGSSTIQVSETVNGASANGRTTEKVDSFCFSKGDVCDYEGSLWATLVLYSLNYDVSKFVPYLLTMMDEEVNQLYLPESFLYFITGKFDLDLLSKQKAGSYWEESGDKFYDTALALWPLYYESPIEKDSSKAWLLNVQQNTGCWNNENVKDTAFILYSVWPKDNPSFGECTFDSDCPDISGKVASCDYGACYYDDVDCVDDDGICGVGCNANNDNDCVGASCTTDADCSEYIAQPEEYCSDDKTQVYESTFEWLCGSNDFCEKEEVSSTIIETCSENEECYSGSCLNKNNPGDDCDDDFDCAFGESCIGGYCTSDNLGCEDEGYFCMSQVNCEGEILYGYSCSGIYSCCDTEIHLNTCYEEGGDICAYNEKCVGGVTSSASDIDNNEICCVGGTCEEDEAGGNAACEDNDGTCRYSCLDGENVNWDYSCGSYNEDCCVETKKESSYLWLWILLFLILILAIGIVFRDKLRIQWIKLKTLIDKKRGKGQKKMDMPFMPSSSVRKSGLPRRILPSSSRQPARRPPALKHRPSSKTPERKPKNELDDVLKKLKEMGK